MANPQRRVAVLVGSIRADSINRKLALAIARLAPQYAFEQLPLEPLPPYNQDLDDRMPEAAQEFKRRIAAADALLFVTPEYNRSVPGVLKNAIDIASRPYGKSSFARKPAGVIGASVGAIGTAVAQQHLRGILAYLDVPTLGQPEAYIQFTDGLIAPDGAVTRESTARFLQGWVEAYTRFVDAQLAGAGHAQAAR